MIKCTHSWWLFTLYTFPKFGFFLRTYHLLNFFGKIDVFVCVRTGYLGWFKICFVLTLLAVLEVETEIVEFEIWVMFLLDLLHVFDFTERAESTGLEEFVFWVVEQIYAWKGFWGIIKHTNRHQFTVNSMQHMVATKELRPHTFIL